MNDKKIVIPILIACIISSLAIANGNTPLAPPFVGSAKVFINYAICIWLLFITNWRKHVRLQLLKIIAILFWFILRVFHVYTAGSLDIVVTLCLITLVSTERRHLLKVLFLYKRFLVIITLLGFISYIDAVTGMHLPHSIVPFAEVDDSMGAVNNAFYLNHYFSYTLIQVDGPRLCTLFNEPGYYGTIVALMLIIDKLNLRNTNNIILLLGGILSMSMAFFILIGAGLVLLGFHDTKLKVLIVVLFLALLFILPNIHFDSDIVNNLLYRFKFDTETMAFIGDDRSNDNIDKLFVEFNHSNKLLFGYGTGYCNRFMEGASTYKKFLIEWGYVGAFLSYGLLMLAALLESKRNKIAVYYSICFMLSIYQRPAIFTMAYFLILFGGIYHILDSTKR